MMVVSLVSPELAKFSYWSAIQKIPVIPDIRFPESLPKRQETCFKSSVTRTGKVLLLVWRHIAS